MKREAKPTANRWLLYKGLLVIIGNCPIINKLIPHALRKLKTMQVNPSTEMVIWTNMFQVKKRLFVAKISFSKDKDGIQGQAQPLGICGRLF